MALDRGLGGWNCRHSFFPYYEGTGRAYTDKELEGLKKGNENAIILSDYEKVALNKRISSDFYSIDEKLRNDKKLDKYESKLVENLGKALDKMPNYKGNAVRVLNIQGKQLEKFLKQNEIGNIYSPKAFQSFSTVEGYNNDTNISIFVVSNKAKDIRKYNPQENEVLYKQNIKFLVENVKYVEGKHYILWRELDE